MLDPFADVAMLEHAALSDTLRDPRDWLNGQHRFDVGLMRDALAALPPTTEQTPGRGERASLARMGHALMTPDMLKRFHKHVRVAQLDWVTPCWLWMGGTHDKGYGRFHLGFLPDDLDPDKRVRVTAYTHRIAFEHWIGPIPQGYIGDHQCNHKVCCNPTHVWPETNTENLRLADQRRPWKRRNQYSQE